MRRLGLHTGALEQVAHAHAGPRRVELAPLRHAVDVERQGHRRHRLQLVEVDGERLVDQAVDRQVPLARRVRRHVADVENRKSIGEVLTRAATDRGRNPSRSALCDCGRRIPCPISLPTRRRRYTSSRHRGTSPTLTAMSSIPPPPPPVPPPPPSAATDVAATGLRRLRRSRRVRRHVPTDRRPDQGVGDAQHRRPSPPAR